MRCFDNNSIITFRRNLVCVRFWDPSRHYFKRSRQDPDADRASIGVGMQPRIPPGQPRVGAARAVPGCGRGAGSPDCAGPAICGGSAARSAPSRPLHRAGGGAAAAVARGLGCGRIKPPAGNSSVGSRA